METWFWVVVCVLLVVVAIWSMVHARSVVRKRVDESIAAFQEFDAKTLYYDMNGGASIALDTARGKIAIIPEYGSAKVIEYGDLLSVEVLKDGVSIQKANRGSQAAGAAVGAVLLGPVGLLLGGLTGSKRSVDKIKKLSIKIFINDIEEPAHEIVFMKGTGVEPVSAVFKAASDELDRWNGRLLAIVHKQESAAVTQKLVTTE